MVRTTCKHPHPHTHTHMYTPTQNKTTTHNNIDTCTLHACTHSSRSRTHYMHAHRYLHTHYMHAYRHLHTHTHTHTCMHTTTCTHHTHRSCVRRTFATSVVPSANTSGNFSWKSCRKALESNRRNSKHLSVWQMCLVLQPVLWMVDGPWLLMHSLESKPNSNYMIFFTFVSFHPLCASHEAFSVGIISVCDWSLDCAAWTDLVAQLLCSCGDLHLPSQVP